MKKIEKLTQPMDASSNESLLLEKINELVEQHNALSSIVRRIVGND